MNITKRAKVLVSGIALVGAVALGGTAFTASGVSTGAGALTEQSIGGTVSATLVGTATLNAIDYGFSDDPANTTVNEVTLTFAAPVTGRTVSVLFNAESTGARTCVISGSTATCAVPTPLSVSSIHVTVA